MQEVFYLTSRLALLTQPVSPWLCSCICIVLILDKNIKSDTFKSIVGLCINADVHTCYRLSHKMRQEEIRRTSSAFTHESTAIPLLCRTSAIKNETLTELIGLLSGLQIGEHVIIRE